MKRSITLLLTLCLLLGLAACGSSETPQQTQAAPTTQATETAAAGGFMAGFGRGDITPTDPVPLGGMSDSSTRVSTGVNSFMLALTVALQDENGNIAILCSVDHICVGELMCNNVRKWAAREFDIPQENILISSIHQHSTPDTANTKVPSGAAYASIMEKGIKDSIESAIKDLKPAEVYINTAQTEAMTFVRNYILADGTFAGTNYGNQNGTYVAHESEADQEMRLVKFVRQDAKDIIMVNFQAHPHMGSVTHERDVHADWPGVMRDEVGERLDAECVYFSGASGNLNSTSRLNENVSVDYKDHGLRAARYVVAAEDSYEKVATGPILCKEVVIEYNVDHTMDHMYNDAVKIVQTRAQDWAAAEKMLKDYPQFHSIYHAAAVVNKFSEGATKSFPISAITFGDIAFTVHPYEMFDTNGVELRSGSAGNANYDADDQLENPFKLTFITTISNGTNGYIPSLLGYTNGGYSTDITYFAPGTGEQLVGDYLRLLNELHK